MLSCALGGGSCPHALPSGCKQCRYSYWRYQVVYVVLNGSAVLEHSIIAYSGPEHLDPVQIELIKSQAQEADVVICDVAPSTAGQRAPTIITAEIISGMKVGSVTVDLAAEVGGNIETTVADKTIMTQNGVTCIGYTSLASKMGAQASALYSDNISNFLLSIGPFTGTMHLARCNAS